MDGSESEISYLSKTCKRVSDCCLAPAQQFFRYIMAMSNKSYKQYSVLFCSIYLYIIVLTVSNQKSSKYVERLFFSKLISHRPPSLLLSSSHIGCIPSCFKYNKNYRHRNKFSMENVLNIILLYTIVDLFCKKGFLISEMSISSTTYQ